MTVPIRVLMLTGEYPPQLGGVGAYTARLCAALDPAVAHVAVLTGGDERRPGERRPGDRVRVLRAVRGWGVGSYPRILRAADAWRADVLHIQYQAGAYALAPAVNLLPLWLRLRRPRLSRAVTFHDLRPPYLFPKAGRLRPASLRLMAGACDGVVCTDPADLRALGERPGRRHIPLASNVDCAPPPDYDRRAWRAAHGLPADAALVGFFGFLNRSKGGETLLRAVAQLPGAHLALIGGEAGASDASDRAEAARIRALEGELGLAGRVWRGGPLADVQVSAALLACDALALPFVDGASARRGTLQAALAHGRAVVTTGGPDAGLMTDGRNALLVPPGDAAALAAALRSILTDPALGSRLERGALALSEAFTWPAIARAHEGWYRELRGRE